MTPINQDLLNIKADIVDLLTKIKYSLPYEFPQNTHHAVRDVKDIKSKLEDILDFIKKEC